MAKDYGILKRQFILSEDESALPPQWPSVSADTWYLSCHTSIPISEIHESDAGGLIGFMLGWPVSPQGHLIKDQVTFPAFESANALQDQLYRYSGSWACMVRIGDEWRVYGDPFHSIPLVYSSDMRFISSSTGLIPKVYREQSRSVAEDLNIPEEDNWYPFGLTPYEQCNRLLPNHYLNLSKKKVVRHWPMSHTFGCYEQMEATSTIINRLQRDTSAFVSDGYPYLSLTAGRDSRVLLACSREVKSSITCHTIAIPDEGARIDLQVARYITRELDI
jgi:hypothetical protein